MTESTSVSRGIRKDGSDTVGFEFNSDGRNAMLNIYARCLSSPSTSHIIDISLDLQATANEAGAGINGEIVREEEAPFIQDVRTTGVGKAEPQEPILNLSPFSEDGSIRADDSWLNGGLRSSKKKKDKKMSWSDD